MPRRRREPSLFESLTPNQRFVLAVGILLFVCITALVRWYLEQPAQYVPPAGEQPGTLANRNIRFGIPTKADLANAYVIDRAQFVLSYNDSKRTANWVSWNLNRHDIGRTPRALHFEPDPELPASFQRVKDNDYAGSGFDRGHLCPSKDRSDSPENNKVTFYTTNIVPQSAQCNQGAWERFESHCRDLTRDGSELYIAAGPFGEGGTGDRGMRNTIGKQPITVPSAVWKVVMVLPSKDALPTQTTRTLAVWMPNDTSVPENWKPYAVSIADVEQRTGFKFFPLVPDEVANSIKNRVERGE